MTTIDQRILIPTPPEVVWEYISDVRNNPRWQTDCTGVVFLTSKVSGPGTRWRQAIEKSGEQVIEITAWYEGLGYQYTYIDGVPFRESTARIRLQEIPEGTVVQWTITYEMGGLLGNVRSSLGLSRRLEAMLVTSLKALWKQVNESGSAQRNREAKSLMRDAPDAEARANYSPRHTPIVDLRAEGEGEAPPPKRASEPVMSQDSDAKYRPPAGAVIPEPPVAEDDTRPRRPVLEPTPAEPVRPRLSIRELVEDAEEPEFLQDMARYAPPSVEPPDMGDTQPIRAITAEEAAAGLAPAQAETAEPDFMDGFALDDADFAPAKVDAEDNANLELSRTPRAQSDISLTDEINALVVGPESWDEPKPNPSFTDEFEALLVEPKAAEPAISPISLTDEMNALLAEPAAAETAPDTPVTEVASEQFTFDETAASAEAVDVTAERDQGATTASTPRIDESAFPAPSMTDTAKMSIWEIFGVPRPSETAEISAVAEAETVETPQEAAPPAAEPEAEAPPAPEPPAEAEAAPAEEAPAEAIPDLSPAVEPVASVVTAPADAGSSGEMMIVEVIREVSGPARRTGLRLRKRLASARVRRPE